MQEDLYEAYVPKVILGIIAVLNKVDANKATGQKTKIETLKNLKWPLFAEIALSVVIEISISEGTYRNAIKKIIKKCKAAKSIDEYEYVCAQFSHYAIPCRNEILKKAQEHLTNKQAVEWPVNDDFDFWLGNTLIDIVITVTGLFELFNKNMGSKKPLHIKTTDNFKNETDKKIRNAVSKRTHHEMAIPTIPKNWTNINNGGFHDNQEPLITNDDKTYLKYMLDHTNDLTEVFNAINIAQHTKWRINRKILEIIKNVYDEDLIINGLPLIEDRPISNCPTGDDKRSLAVWQEEAEYISGKNNKNNNKKLQFAKALDEADLLKEYESFYFVYHADWRGRIYPVGLINPQGADWQKALLEFADGIPITEKGAYWLRIHLANTYGADKCNFENRVKWVEEHEPEILKNADDPMGTIFWREAAEPFCFLAACIEYSRYKREGNDYISRLPISLDATCSTLQHWAALLKDNELARSTNVTFNKNGRCDLYQEIADKALELIKEKRDEEAAQYIIKNNLITRKLVKKIAMNYANGITYFTAQGYIYDFLYDSLVGNRYKLKLEIISMITKNTWNATKDTLNAPYLGMMYLHKLCKIHNRYCPDKAIEWKAPSGFPVRQLYIKPNKYTKALQVGGKIESYKDMPVWSNGDKKIRIEAYKKSSKKDKKKQSNSLPANFVQSMDAALLVKIINEANRSIGTSDFMLIHDSFGLHAAYCEKFHDILINCFIDMYKKYNPLEGIGENIRMAINNMSKMPDPPQIGDIDFSQIVPSNYLFS